MAPPLTEVADIQLQTSNCQTSLLYGTTTGKKSIKIVKNYKPVRITILVVI